MVRWLAEHPLGRELIGRRGEAPIVMTVNKAAQKFHFGVMQYLCEQFFQESGEGPSGGTVLSAVEKGRVDCVKWLLERFSFVNSLSAEDVVEKAVLWCQVGILPYFHGVDMLEKFQTIQENDGRVKRQRTGTSKPRWPRCCNVVKMAAENGDLPVFQWLYENRWSECSPRENSSEAMDTAAASGWLHIVKWLHRIPSIGCSAAAMDRAAANGSLDVRWLHKNRTEGCTTDAMDEAAYGGYLKLVKWLHAHRKEGCSTHALDSAQQTASWRWSSGCGRIGARLY
ncbi:hypothetical protein PHYSODRAFT_342319 [Phytophthora sojae]|uniref:Ankyrin repeat-containing domain n=1 Tax=Phytophthora sojae (strain P6497) TaxID=1094619 RepID=G5AFY8_PHYSP|nr:hypothetical protein PHYSODRAFT_342319 [Phytophthora sojae]EGZ05648.1 hypothetical protein PHYSODRAFT_342319 [Phytophthora sojae]|eukprot:XP_009539179.1 hypothetical protein PHYSODRAFT_342319 [Phytophthora sojae]